MKYIPFLFFIFAFNSLFAQTDITGKVIDKITQKTLPNVAIQNKKGNLGTIANLDGIFKINADNTDSLLFSSIGYKAKIVAVKDVSNTIELEILNYQLPEVTISSLRAKDILQKVVDNYDRNYNSDEDSYTVQIKLFNTADDTTTQVRLASGIMQSNNKKKTGVFYLSQEQFSYADSSTVLSSFGRNTNLKNQLDVLYLKDNLQNYLKRIDSKEVTEVILSQNIYGERQVYEIKSTSHNGFSHLIIDKNSYGIIELNYESSKAHLTEYDGTYTLPKGEKYRYAATGSVGKMRFREYEGRWVLSGFYAQSKHFYELAGRQFESQSTLDFVAGRVLKKEKRNLRGLNKLATSENMMQVIQRKISPAEAKKIFNLTEKEAQSIR